MAKHFLVHITWSFKKKTKRKQARTLLFFSCSTNLMKSGLKTNNLQSGTEMFRADCQLDVMTEFCVFTSFFLLLVWENRPCIQWSSWSRTHLPDCSVSFELGQHFLLHCYLQIEKRNSRICHGITQIHKNTNILYVLGLTLHKILKGLSGEL